MKPKLLLLVAILSSLSISCSKDYTCTCNRTDIDKSVTPHDTTFSNYSIEYKKNVHTSYSTIIDLCNQESNFYEDDDLKTIKICELNE